MGEAGGAACHRVRGASSAAWQTFARTQVDASNRTQLVRKRSIHEAELTLDASTQQLAPLCHLINQDATLATMLNVLLPHLRLDSQVRAG